MSTPQALARQLAPKLSHCCWAIGGSTLLQHLDLVETARDLDIVTSSEDFAAVCAVLATLGERQDVAADPRYATPYFARFVLADGSFCDVMAELTIVLEKGRFRWPFDASAVQQADGLPWCYAEDWALLYRLMAREEQVEALDEWLEEHGVQQPQRLVANLFAQYPEKLLHPAPAWWPWED